ncbi:hypothetical protein [Lacihabitans sp. LS3-19]|uniref:hypothetical protein n=1 Tax=Lacihabitans sp. LS3-19 TaxID=2487335 RepID=UPI0020CB8E13|nr:hypothetical protein [Lacihabitans sp. LS3-19]
MSKKLHLNRRDFIEKSAVLAAGISLSMNSSCSESSANKTVNGACCLDCPDSCS